MNDIDRYYKSLVQEVAARQLSNEEGDTQEQAFTRLFLDLLSEAGETENTTVAYDEKDFGTKKTHKINGYAISDNYETVDLFITIYKQEETIPVIYKKDIFPTKKVPFEQGEMKVMQHVEAYLSKRFGDYMTLPPEEKRHNHPPYLFDLGK